MDPPGLIDMNYFILILKLILIINFTFLAIFDWRKFRLPDILQLTALIIITLIYILSTTDWRVVLIGMLTGLVIGLLIYYLSSIFYRQQAFGIGDVKLLAVLGYLSGIQNFLYVLVGGTLTATIYALVGVVIGRWKFFMYCSDSIYYLLKILAFFQ